MSDAITELQRIKRILIVEAVKLGESHVCEVSVLDEVIDARIAELEAQQAEPSDADALVDALANINWGQITLNNMRGDNAGACFQVEDCGMRGPRICGRAAAWAGHDSDHLYVPLHVAVSEAMRRGRGDQRLREAAAEVVAACRAAIAEQVLSHPDEHYRADVWDRRVAVALAALRAAQERR